MIPGKKGLYLPEEFIPVGVKGQERIVEVSLKDAKRAIHRAVGKGIDHVIATAEMTGGPRAGFQTSPIKMGEEEVFLSCSDGILLGEDCLNEGFLIRHSLYGKMGKTL